jgi:hypothetical protein
VAAARLACPSLARACVACPILITGTCILARLVLSVLTFLRLGFTSLAGFMAAFGVAAVAARPVLLRSLARLGLGLLLSTRELFVISGVALGLVVV